MAANPEELIIRDPSRSMRSLVHKMKTSRTNVRKDVAGRLEIKIL
jgi:hypothetical protein